jgi:RNA polymerase sigma factor (sigma-70 family)
MEEQEWLAARFEENRPHLKAVAYRMLGSVSEAEDAVQDTWVRLSRSDADGIDNLGGWLTTVVARVCLNLLRSRHLGEERTLQAAMPDPLVSREGWGEPEQEALLADSVGLALLVVLDTLAPAERLAFVLHDMFDVPFEDIGQMLDRSPAAARQLASRARRRVQGAAIPESDVDLQRQREVVDAFLAAARRHDFDSLVSVLHPDVVLRAEGGGGGPGGWVIRGSTAVARGAVRFSDPEAVVHPVLVNGSAGAVVTIGGRPVSVMSFTIAGGRIVEMDGISDPERVERLVSAIPGGLPEGA